MNWTLSDFLIFGFMVGGAAGLVALTLRSTGNVRYRVAMGLALAATFLLIWINGAVGIVGASNNNANMVFLAVPAVGFIGAFIARFRPEGMAHAMLAAALAQILAVVIAISINTDTMGPAWPWDALVLTALFTGLWLLSFFLFRKSGRLAG